jgi:hydroxymethylbilane synthase
VSGSLRVATRRSALARAQSQLVADQLAAATGRTVELVEVTTRGDVDLSPLALQGGTGVFVTAVRDAVLAGHADIAVHSLKDLPVSPCDGLLLAAIPVREDPRDALCARDGLRLAQLPHGARIGTGSPRRAAQLRLVRPDVDVVAVRGNVDTRLRLVADGDVDAVVLALAGLARLGRTAAATEVLDPETMLPAPGQGALAVESRVGLEQTDPELFAALDGLDHGATRAAVSAERSVLGALEAGCSAPVGAYAVLIGPEASLMYLTASVFELDGRSQVRKSISGPVGEAVELGEILAADLLAAGAPGLFGERVP